MRRISDAVLSVLIFLIRISPHWLYRLKVNALVMTLYVVAGKKLRRNAAESLEIAFGNTMPAEEKQRIVRASYFNLFRGLADYVYGAFHPRWTMERFEVDGRDALDAALKDGKGVVIAVAHFGPFGCLMRKFVEMGHACKVVMRPPRSQWMHGKLVELGEDVRLRPIYSVPIRRCVLEATQALARNEIVFMPIDQNYGSAGRVFVNFFGRLAATAPGPAIFAQKTGAALFFAHTLSLGGGRFRVVMSPRVPVASPEQDPDAVRHATATLTTMVETVVRQCPDQWSWMHRRWKAVPRDGEIE